VDPSITIDPSWLASHPDAQLQIATFLTPEPASLVLLGSGLLALGSVVRKKWLC
jgi:hypothetical protein